MTTLGFGSDSPDPRVVADELRPTHVQVDLGAIQSNLQAIKEHVGRAKVMPIIKANAYGHGLLEVARKLEDLDTEIVGVAYLEEALHLRRNGVLTPILVLGGPVQSQLSTLLDHDLAITVPSLEVLDQLENVARAKGTVARVHLKIDTGMGRLGVAYTRAEPLLAAAHESEQVVVEGIYSHLANADEADLTSARTQVERFGEVCEFYSRNSLPMPIRHIANSGGILQLPESHLDLVRPGIMTFGIYPSAEVLRSVKLEPALRWQSNIVFSKVIEKGSAVSYGSTWQASQQTRIVTLPVGYGDGYLRAMSGSAQVLIASKLYVTVGRICMDQVVADVGDDDIQSGATVVLVGRDGDAVLSVENLARWAGTIPYEVLTNISARVPRIYCDN